MTKVFGEVIQVIGPVVDVAFSIADDSMPNIHDALVIKRDDGSKLVVECQQHIGERTIRAIAMDSTDGLHRGMKVESTGKSITVPTG
ncbi:MAG: F0F1 ATP synthase subunit beta, partial [Bacteroidetes bacterium HGW-Bacteroidetes-15]